MHLHTIMKSGTSFLPCGNVEAHQTRNVQSQVCPTKKGSVYERKKKKHAKPAPWSRTPRPPQRRERKKKKKTKSLSPQKRPQERNNGVQPNTLPAQPKVRTTNPLPRPNQRGKTQIPCPNTQASSSLHSDSEGEGTAARWTARKNRNR